MSLWEMDFDVTQADAKTRSSRTTPSQRLRYPRPYTTWILYAAFKDGNGFINHDELKPAGLGELHIFPFMMKRVKAIHEVVRRRRL
jgi:hypothetical protein